MLADSCEAAVRSLKEPTPKYIENIVQTIIEDRLHDRQFDDCNLALKHLETIKVIFIKILTGAYHRRIEYPETLLK